MARILILAFVLVIMGCISQCYVLNGEEERLPLQPEGYAPEDRGYKTPGPNGEEPRLCLGYDGKGTTSCGRPWFKENCPKTCGGPGGKLYVLKDVGTGCGDLSVPKEECHKAAEKEYVSEKGFKIRDLDFFVENEESTPPGCYLGHKHSCKRSCVYAYNMYDPSKAWTCADKCQPYAEVFFNENPKGTTGSNFREANQITRIRSVCQYKKVKDGAEDNSDKGSDSGGATKRYSIGNNDEECSSDSLIIENLGECESAALSLGIKIKSKWTDGHYNWIPGGCSISDDGTLHFNTGKYSLVCCHGRRDLKPICKTTGTEPKSAPVEGSTHEYCCGVLEKYPDFVPYKTWGSLVDGNERAKWNKNNCNVLVGGSKKGKCAA